MIIILSSAGFAGRIVADEGLNTTDQYEHEPILIKEQFHGHIPRSRVEIYAAYTFTVTKAAQSQPRGRRPTANGQQEHPVPCPQEGPKKWMNRLTQSFNTHTGEFTTLWCHQYHSVH